MSPPDTSASVSVPTAPAAPQGAPQGDPAPVIREFIVTNFLFGDDAGLGDDSSLVEAGALDSTGVLELVAFIEEHFGIAIDDRDLVPENLQSITCIAAFVTRRQQAVSAVG